MGCGRTALVEMLHWIDRECHTKKVEMGPPYFAYLEALGENEEKIDRFFEKDEEGIKTAREKFRKDMQIFIKSYSCSFTPGRS
jgi:hypothetical protein